MLSFFTKVSAAAVPTSRNTGPKARKPVTENGARQPWVVAMDESDDSKSSTSDSVTASPTKRFAPTIVKVCNNGLFFLV